MLLAAEPVTSPEHEAMATGTFNMFGITFDYFDFFVIAFTILIAIGVYRSLKAEQKNVVAIGFGGVSLLVFVIMDYIMVKNWLFPGLT
ncbi:DUF2759 family protein [Paenibacillus psychroresistens]